MATAKNIYRGGGRKPDLETARERFVKHVLEWLRDGGFEPGLDFRIQKGYTIKDVVEAYMKYEAEVTQRVVKTSRIRTHEETRGRSSFGVHKFTDDSGVWNGD
jgi:hypothetical protein